MIFTTRIEFFGSRLISLQERITLSTRKIQKKLNILTRTYQDGTASTNSTQDS